MNVHFLDPAREELLAAVDFYEEQVAGLGDDFLTEVEHALDSIRQSPSLGSPFTEETRRVLLHRFPFHIVYTVDSQNIVVLAVAHQRRKPGYWKGRK